MIRLKYDYFLYTFLIAPVYPKKVYAASTYEVCNISTPVILQVEPVIYPGTVY